ncbi:MULTISPECIES: glycoside hydrolase family 27 protein [unclassified Actinomyces]|uniref:glycoside hydrolase family 27 protein n=1 Tax=unclassified Actinomyces TaxID=2609248 RepID=UPI002016A9D8|nr:MULTISPECIES: glycoside hydrolase family 27 protein [unclassified Actinomyces]MCL3777136.1 glycoside hydrolase family 27 protein [Actinomyces sp. AC-20-1]MCL3788948.1 glycoside hydrolase family 27 protein [Actinomyces sp. 187325]MCL3791322.1 glycoside hydrolase family 27 protein [Actinomyces sp. 186855]MCL3794153.1 glycoside hydrolase family 27 protein [Actinomyces sp. 217892]
MTTPSPRPATFPPRGWNSWDCFGGSVTEAEVLDNARFMRDHLLTHGWDTVVVDIQWYEPDPGHGGYNDVSRAVIDAYGRPLPAPGRFPSAASGRGFEPLADAVHAMGLRFGVHLMRGVPQAAVAAATPVLGTGLTARDIAAPPSQRCPWNPDNEGVLPDHPGSQAWYDSVFALLAAWGVDLVKVDDVLYPPIRRADIAMIRTAIERCGRPMVLSLSPGKALSLEQDEFLHAHAQAWRVSDDLWDRWPSVVEQFQRAARWARSQSDTGVGDLDMLPLGRIGVRAHVGEPRHSRLTHDEQRTMLTLWSIARSPLMMGGHLPASPPETIALLQADAVLAVDERGSGCREIIRDQGLVVWRSTVRPAVPGAASQEVRAVFNLDDGRVTHRLHVDDLGLPGRTSLLTDLWTGERVPVTDGWWRTSLPAHGCAMVAT